MSKHLLLLPMLCLTSMAFAADPPSQFGSDHDDPRTAYPAVPRPSTPACSIDIVDHGFTNFEPALASIDAKKSCPGPWNKVVLEMDGEVKGRQYDRIGHIAIGGVTVLRTSSPEPSRDGIAWHVEKDVSAYAPLFAAGKQPVEMHLGNVVNETYTGIFKIKAKLQFYRADAQHPAAATADSVAALDDLRADGMDTVGKLTLPANAERLIAEVHATGSGGGCEEFWYFAAPEAAKEYWCKAPQGPYREVQVLIDGVVAGIAAPYPHIYTGGWSNPFLWYAIPAPRTFDMRPLRFELTPFIGTINDGKPHEIRLKVLGVPAGKEGWALQPSVQVWRDAGSKRTHGRLLKTEVSPLELSHPLEGGGNAGDTQLNARARHGFAASGELHTSHGVVVTRVERMLGVDIDHAWTAEEDGNDRLHAEWTDGESIERSGDHKGSQSSLVTQRFGLFGGIATVTDNGNPRLTTTLRIHDDAEVRLDTDGKETWNESHDVFDGSASYTMKVPREQRRATASTSQDYHYRDSTGACVARRIESRDGRFLPDREGCEETAPGEKKREGG